MLVNIHNFKTNIKAKIQIFFFCKCLVNLLFKNLILKKENL